MENARPIVGISVGDPGGIGPEVTVKALWSLAMLLWCVTPCALPA